MRFPFATILSTLARNACPLASWHASDTLKSTTRTTSSNGSYLTTPRRCRKQNHIGGHAANLRSRGPAPNETRNLMKRLTSIKNDGSDDHRPQRVQVHHVPGIIIRDRARIQYNDKFTHSLNQGATVESIDPDRVGTA